MRSEFIEGRWRLEGDVLFEDYTYQEDYEGPRVANSVRTRLTRLGDDRFGWTALDGSQSGVYDRCPPN